MRSLGSVSFRTLRRARGRSLLTASGVTLGVALLLAVQVANESASEAFARRFLTGARSAVLVTAPSADVPDDVIDLAVDLPGVHAVSTTTGFDVRLADRDEPIWFAGYAFRRGSAFEPRPAPEQITASGEPPEPGALEVSVGSATAADLSLELGDTVRINTPTGPAAVTITQIWSRNDGEPYEAGLSTSVETADRLGGAGVHRTAYIELAPGIGADGWLDDHATAFPPSVTVSPSGPDVAGFRDLVRALDRGFALAAALAVFVGAFLIFLTMSLQVTERTALFGTYRALGATRGQVARTVLAEALWLGAVASVAGLAVGLGVALALTDVVAGLYGIERPSLVVPPVAVGVAFATGIIGTVVGAAVPASRAARLDAVAAMRSATVTTPPRWLPALGAVMLTGATISALVRPPTPNDPTLLAVLLGAVLVVPAFVPAFAAAAARLAPSLGRVGVLHMRNERTRAAGTIGLVMVVLATVLVLTITRSSFDATTNRILGATLGADAIVRGSGLDRDAIQTVRGLPEVGTVTTIRFIGGRLGDTTAEILAIDPETYFDVLGFPLLQGTESRVRDAMTGDAAAAVIASGDARDLGLAPGDHFALDTPKGPIEVTVIGIMANMSGGWHPVFISNAFMDRAFGAGPPTELRIDAAPSIAPARLLDALDAATNSRFQVLSGEDFRHDLASFNARLFSVFEVVLLVALLVGGLGLANTLAFTVLRRTREIGVLRSIGTQRRSVAGMILVEALALAGCAAVLAVPLGTAIAALIVRTVAAELGTAISFTFPWTWLPVLFGTAILLATLAALIPARRATTVDPVAALRFD